MHCKVSLQSILEFIIIVAIVVGVCYVIYLLHPWVMSFLVRNISLIGGILIVLLMYINIKMPGVDVFNVKGYVVFSVCSLVAHGLIISLLIVLGLWLEVEISEHSFPWVVCIVAPSIYAILLNGYSCLVRRTLLKRPHLKKKVVSAMPQ